MKKRIGIKVPFDIFGSCMSESSKMILESFGGRDKFFEFLSQEVGYAELGYVFFDTDKNIVKEAVSECNGFGINVIFHGTMENIKTADDFFRPYLLLFESGLQSCYYITVHPFDNPDETQKMLSEICRIIDDKHYPSRITLENQRYKSANKLHSMCNDVAKIVSNIGSKNLFCCFDFGHQLCNIRQNGDSFDETDDVFLSLVRHTHIHSLFDGITHFPLSCGEVLLEQNIQALARFNYDGVYLLELAPRRYYDKFDIKTSIANSISILKVALMQIERKANTTEDYEKNYVSHIEAIRRKLKNSVCGFAVLGSSTYIVKLGDVKIAVDPSLSNMPVCENAREELINLLKECDAVIITHEHGDHFESNLIELLPKDIVLFIPDFISFKQDNVTFTKDGYKAWLKGAEITFFESMHSVEENIVPEYGFAIGYNGKNYVFPADVRNYKAKQPVFPNTDAVVVHLWLGKNNALRLYDNMYIDDFSKFTTAFGANKVYISHLFDVRRNIENMWTDIHCCLVNKNIKNSQMIRLGDWIEL